MSVTISISKCGCLLMLLLCVVWPYRLRAAGVEVDWEAVFGGEVVVEAVQNREGIPGVRAMFVVAASREHIWSVLVDYSNFPRFFKGIKKLRVIEQDVRGAKVELWTPVAFINFHYILHRRYVEPGRRLTWTQISGDMKRIEGGWEIRDTPRSGVYLLLYESFVEVGGVIPTKLVRRGALSKARKMGKQLRAWIENKPPDR